ncbi:hypothetical protein GCM10009555_017980 [Acrocarpospora macrocephala]|uniref:HTH cro/C1-type domain-containing protein n=1 Tax=Acrocarpospora macrocephala TaxID=150177 RepID=A0A5M3WMB2_9ACTN|nr:helix-turn-helix transcriptional regulator [Acrocarpospora macrocephala]GES07458.1 hypothetical protein Amac_010530 [Acrocarpospora macrocephala]
MREPTTTSPADLEARHGYTMRDLDRLAHAAVRTARGTGTNYQDRADAAWHAIAEALVAAAERPTGGDLTAAGWKAVNRAVADERHRHGAHPDGGKRRGFMRYWEGAGWHPQEPDAAAERVALAQIWPRLTPGEQRVLAALAEHHTYTAAAAALGLGYHSYASLLRRARHKCQALWHGVDSPVGERKACMPDSPPKYANLNRILAERIVRLRRARGWSAEQLASALTRAGRLTNRSTLANVETLHSKIPADLLVALAEVFAVPVAKLAALECGVCEGAPPAGFTCTACGSAAGPVGGRADG